MTDTPVNNRKIVLNPVNKPKIDIGESTIFSKKVDANLWETASSLIKTKKPKEQTLQNQIFKFEQETQKYEQILSKTNGNKLDING